MAYSTSSPPRRLFAAGIGNTAQFWYYSSADAAATVDASGYFTDGYNLGMRDGDFLFCYNTASKIMTGHVVTVSGTTVNVADGTTIGSSTNTD